MKECNISIKLVLYLSFLLNTMQHNNLLKNNNRSINKKVIFSNIKKKFLCVSSLK